MPVEPPATRWDLTSLGPPDDDGIAGLGADLEPGTVLAAYRAGYFPMHLGGDERQPLAWWSPDPRGVLPLDGVSVSRSLRRSVRRYHVTVDAAFDDVIASCAASSRPGRWINDDIVAAYTRLHALGWVHSVETWSDDGDLVGGLYGVSIGGLFAGESMFHRARDASKVALVGLVERLRDRGGRLVDVQWVTSHLASLGAIEIPRPRYLDLVADAVARPPLPWPDVRS